MTRSFRGIFSGTRAFSGSISGTRAFSGSISGRWALDGVVAGAQGLGFRGGLFDGHWDDPESCQWGPCAAENDFVFEKYRDVASGEADITASITELADGEKRAGC
jgi:hypothetical protein